jgi:hypothetical protein
VLTLWSTTLLDPAKNHPNHFVSLLGGFAVGPLLEVSVAISAAPLLVFASNTALIGTYNACVSSTRAGSFGVVRSGEPCIGST